MTHTRQCMMGRYELIHWCGEHVHNCYVNGTSKVTPPLTKGMQIKALKHGLLERNTHLLQTSQWVWQSLWHQGIHTLQAVVTKGTEATHQRIGSVRYGSVWSTMAEVSCGTGACNPTSQAVTPWGIYLKENKSLHNFFFFLKFIKTKLR